MAYKQLGLVELITSIQKRVKSGTGLECYDAVELNAASPFYFAQVVGKRPAHTKTMWRDVFTVWIHAIAEKGDSSVQIYELIQNLEEALTEEIILPEEYELVMQINNGIQTIKKMRQMKSMLYLPMSLWCAMGLNAKFRRRNMKNKKFNRLQLFAYDDNAYCDFTSSSAKAVAGKDILLAIYNADGTKLLAISGQQGLTITEVLIVSRSHQKIH